MIWINVISYFHVGGLPIISHNINETYYTMVWIWNTFISVLIVNTYKGLGLGFLCKYIFLLKHYNLIEVNDKLVSHDLQ